MANMGRQGVGAANGVFISIEGGDGTGKTTQCELLAQHLQAQGVDVLLLHEPGCTRVGERVRSILLDPDLTEMDPVAELLLYEAARAQVVAEVIQPALLAGKTVLCDRFADSTTVYQGVARALGTGLTSQLNAVATHGVMPARTVLLQVDRRTASQRLGARTPDGSLDRMERAGAEFHQRVGKGFEALAQADPQRIRVVDARGSVEDVQARVFAALEDLFDGVAAPSR